MSGRPAGAGPADSCTLVVAAVVINPPRSRTLPKPDLRNGCGLGARRTLAEGNGWEKAAAQSKFHCVIIKISANPGFGKAALRITPYFHHDNLARPGRCLAPMALLSAPASC